MMRAPGSPAAMRATMSRAIRRLCESGRGLTRICRIVVMIAAIEPIGAGAVESKIAACGRRGEGGERNGGGCGARRDRAVVPAAGAEGAAGVALGAARRTPRSARHRSRRGQGFRAFLPEDRK